MKVLPFLGLLSRLVDGLIHFSSFYFLMKKTLFFFVFSLKRVVWVLECLFEAVLWLLYGSFFPSFFEEIFSFPPTVEWCRCEAFCPSIGAHTRTWCPLSTKWFLSPDDTVVPPSLNVSYMDVVRLLPPDTKCEHSWVDQSLFIPDFLGVLLTLADLEHFQILLPPPLSPSLTTCLRKFFAPPPPVKPFELVRIPSSCQNKIQFPFFSPSFPL